MKRKYLHFKGVLCYFSIVAVFSFTLIFISTSSVSAQANELVSTGEIAGSEWKSLTDYIAVISSERVTTTQSLAASSGQDFETALYTVYDRMLVYIQGDIANNVPIPEIAVKNFKKVMLEYPSDPLLKNMREGEFRAMYASLIEKLVQPINHDIGH